MLESMALTVPIVRLELLEKAIVFFGTQTKARRKVQRNTIFLPPSSNQSPASKKTPHFQPKSDAQNDRISLYINLETLVSVGRFQELRVMAQKVLSSSYHGDTNSELLQSVLGMW